MALFFYSFLLFAVLIFFFLYIFNKYIFLFALIGYLGFGMQLKNYGTVGMSLISNLGL